MSSPFAWSLRAMTSVAHRCLATTAAAVRVLKPTSPGMRGTVRADRSMLYAGRPLQSLSVGMRSRAGRNNQGRITVRHRGGGHKRRYRLIDFKRTIVDHVGIIQRLEYDPNRSAHLALVLYGDSGAGSGSGAGAAAEPVPKADRLSYMIAPEGVAPGDRVEASRTVALDCKPGNAMLLRHVPIGQVVHNVEMAPGRGAQMARSAGLYCTLIEKGDKYATLRLPSKEERLFLLTCLATIGVVSNPNRKFEKLGKAGKSRHLGRRPTVRGVAMNPIDHPHGGGEGKTSGGRCSVSPTGQLAKGFKTRKVTKSTLLIVRRRDGRLVRKGAKKASYASKR